MKLKHTIQCCLPVALCMALCGGAPRAAAAPAATTTTLAVTSGGSAVTTITSGSVVTLTATVVAGTTPVNPGQVKFCDAAAAHCEDIHIVGMAQLTKAGTATFKFRPGVGSHSYKAVFVGTKSDAGSASGTAALTVAGTYPTATAIAQSGSPGNYTLTATVGGTGNKAPTGTVSFLDTSNGNAVLATATLGEGTAALNFLNSSNPATGLDPWAVAVGDFNGDGILDLAVANACGSDPICRSGGTVTVLLGNGDGTFTPAASPATGGGASPIAVGDFNGDGIPDLAVPGGPVLLGNGDGTFRAAAGAALPGGSAIAVGDFNGDGIPDLAVANLCGGDPTCHSNSTVTVLLGNGDGTFTATATSLQTGGGTTGYISVVAGDFNQDGIPDLAVLSQDFGLMIFLGNGDGTFTAAATSPALPRSEPVSIVVADFNGDGIPDLALANQDSTVTILLGNGDGTFTATATSPRTGEGSTGFTSIAVGDFNGDGIPDLAVMDECGRDYDCSVNTMTVLLGNGDGTFADAATSPEAGGQPYSIAVGDFNGDGISDLAAAEQSYPDNGTVEVLLTEAQTATASAGGVALPVASGAHQVVASYPGDSDYNPSTSFPTALTGAGTPVPASLTSPTPGSTLPGSSVVFTWTAGTGTTGYQLWLGTTGVGSHNLYYSGSTMATSATVTGLPTYGQTVYATLMSTIAGASWQLADYTYTEAGMPLPAALTSPTPGSMLTEPSLYFGWTAGVGPTAYQLWLGTTGAGSSNLYNSGVTTATSASVTGLPANGQTVYATLGSLIGGVWQYANYTYTEAGPPAALTSPAPGSVLPGSSVTFAWTGGTGVTVYQLWLGTTGVGSYNLYYSSTTMATTVTVNGLPTNGVTVFARLRSEIYGSWQSIDYLYTEAGTPVPAALTSPIPGSVLAGSSVAFAWTAGTGPTAYQLYLGTTGVGSYNLYDSGSTTATTKTVNGLPTNGATVFARLWSLINGTWRSSDYTYTEAGTLAPAALTSPTPGSTLTGSSVTFTWTGGAGPAAYQLYLGTTGVGSYNLYDSGSTTATTATVNGLPTTGVKVFARFYQLISGKWQHTDYTYTAQ